MGEIKQQNEITGIVSWLREQLLRLLFPLTLVWFFLEMFAGEIDKLFGLVLIPEEHRLHNIIEVIIAVTVPVILIGIFGAISTSLYRRWHGFMLVPQSISLSFLIIRLLVYAPLLFVLLTVSSFVGWWLLVVMPFEDPKHTQYGLSAAFAAIFYPSILTPVITVIVVWLSSLRKHRCFSL